MRGKRAKRKSQIGDIKYGNPIISRLINKVMQDGKKSLAQDLVYSAIEEGAKRAKADDVNAFFNKEIGRASCRERV